MLTTEQIQAAKDEAVKQLFECEYKTAVTLEKHRLMEAKSRLFPKRIVFQWPVRFEDWVKKSKCGGC